MFSGSEFFEKRKERRHKDDSEVMLESMLKEETSHGKKICHAVVHDLSLNGMRLESNTFFPVNSPLKINLSLSRLQNLIKLNGVIRWVNNKFENELFSCGIEFLDVSPENSLNLIGQLHGLANK